MRALSPSERDTYEQMTFGEVVSYMIKHVRTNPDSSQYGEMHPKMADSLERYLSYNDDPRCGYVVRAKVYDKWKQPMKNVDKRRYTMSLEETVLPYIENRVLDMPRRGAKEYDGLDIMVELHPIAASDM